MQSTKCTIHCRQCGTVGLCLLKTLVSHVADNFWKWLVDATILMWRVIQFRKRRSQSLTDIKYWEKVKPLETQVFQMDWKKCDAWGLYGQKASNLWLDHTGNAQLNYLSKCDCEYDRSQPQIIYRPKHALSILEFCYVSHVPPGTCEFVKGKAMEKVGDVGGLVRYSLIIGWIILFEIPISFPQTCGQNVLK